jgi:hypothetical protein
MAIRVPSQNGTQIRQFEYREDARRSRSRFSARPRQILLCLKSIATGYGRADPLKNPPVREFWNFSLA